MKESKLDIRNTTKGKLPRLPFLAMKEAVLGRDYELSIAFVTPARSRGLNNMYRGKDKSANVLAFPMGKSRGELIVDLATVKKSETFGRLGAKVAAYYIIHGLVHLKGLDHGVTMERIEERMRARFDI